MSDKILETIDQQLMRLEAVARTRLTMSQGDKQYSNMDIEHLCKMHLKTIRRERIGDGSGPWPNAQEMTNFEAEIRAAVIEAEDHGNGTRTIHQAKLLGVGYTANQNRYKAPTVKMYDKKLKCDECGGTYVKMSGVITTEDGVVVNLEEYFKCSNCGDLLLPLPACKAIENARHYASKKRQ